MHLYDNDCYPDEEFQSDFVELWKNGVNGEVCTVPLDEELALMTWGHIVYQLGIPPPINCDDEYHVYVSFHESKLTGLKEQLRKN